jgi:nucleotide-binding universal stress UspA family protein
MFNRILVTMDNSEAVSPSTFEKAMALAKQNHARLMLLHVLPTQTPQQTDEMNRLQSLHQTAKTEGLASDVAQLCGEHDHVVCHLAHRWGADLIVLGQHDEALQDDCAPPSWITDQAPCSVLFAHKPDSLHLKASPVEQIAMMV